jgi:hypothetical protein
MYKVKIRSFLFTFLNAKPAKKAQRANYIMDEGLMIKEESKKLQNPTFNIKSPERATSD